MLLLLKNRVALVEYRQINITKYVNQSNQQQIIRTNYKTDSQYNKVIKKNNFRLGIVFTALQNAGPSGCVFLGRVFKNAAQNCIKPCFLKTGLKGAKPSRVLYAGP